MSRRKATRTDIEMIAQISGTAWAACSQCWSAREVTEVLQRPPYYETSQCCSAQIATVLPEVIRQGNGARKVYCISYDNSPNLHQISDSPEQALASHYETYGGICNCSKCAAINTTVSPSIDRYVEADLENLPRIIDSICGKDSTSIIEGAFIDMHIRDKGYSDVGWSVIGVCSPAEYRKGLMTWIRKQVRSGKYHQALRHLIGRDIVNGKLSSDPSIARAIANVSEVTWTNLLSCGCHETMYFRCWLGRGGYRSLACQNTIDYAAKQVSGVRTLDNWPRCMMCYSPLCLSKFNTHQEHTSLPYCHKCHGFSYIEARLLEGEQCTV